MPYMRTRLYDEAGNLKPQGNYILHRLLIGMNELMKESVKSGYDIDDVVAVGKLALQGAILQARAAGK